jgi:hypothetical protein
MMVMADLAPPHPAEKFLRPIRAGTVQAVRILMIDALHFEAAVKIVPCAGFIGMDDGAFCAQSDASKLHWRIFSAA